MLSLEKPFPGGDPAALPTLGHHPSAAPGAELWGCWERGPAVGTMAGVGERGLPWGVGHTWTPTRLTLCPLLPGTVWPSASSTAALASWPALPSSPSWASWRGSRACPSPRWPNRVSGAAVGWGRGGAALWAPLSKGSVPAGYPPWSKQSQLRVPILVGSSAFCLQRPGRNKCTLMKY